MSKSPIEVQRDSVLPWRWQWSLTDSGTYGYSFKIRGHAWSMGRAYRRGVKAWMQRREHEDNMAAQIEVLSWR